MRGPTATLAAMTLILCASAPPGLGAAVTSVLVRGPAGQVVNHVPVTFGQVFRPGDIRDGVAARIDGRPVPLQSDVKRRHPDGSVRFAILSLVLDRVPADGAVAVELHGGPPAPPSDPPAPQDLLKTGFDAVVRFRFPDGSESSAGARALLEKNAPRTWLRGPVVTEWLVDGPPSDPAGHADPDLNVQFQVRAYAGLKTVIVSTVVENCWDTWAGNIGYDVSVRLGLGDAEPAWEKKGVEHGRLARWRKVFFRGEPPPPLTVAHDPAYLAATGAVPDYDSTLRLPPKVLDYARRPAELDILQRGHLTAYMPTTGGRLEIGPYPAWTAARLMTSDPSLARMVLDAGDLAGSWPVHVRNARTRRLLTIDQRPDFWLDDRGKDRPRWQPDRKPRPAAAPRLVPDCAHQPSLAYVPYLLTGDFYYLEEAYFWANYCLLSQWPGPARSPTRQRDRGLMADQVRGNAWGLRNLADAAFVASDADPEAAYFDQKVRNNLESMTKAMCGPPEFNPMGFWAPRSVPDARIQNAANPDWLVVAPWETDFLIWSLHHLAQLGYAGAAAPRDFLLRARVGALTHAPDFDPDAAAPYRMVIGEQRGDRAVIYQDWKQLAAENAKLYKPQLPTYPGSYAYVLRVAIACGVDAKFPGASDALQVLESRLPNPRDHLAAEPAWAIRPRGAR